MWCHVVCVFTVAADNNLPSSLMAAVIVKWVAWCVCLLWVASVPQIPLIIAVLFSFYESSEGLVLLQSETWACVCTACRSDHNDVAFTQGDTVVSFEHLKLCKKRIWCMPGKERQTQFADNKRLVNKLEMKYWALDADAPLPHDKPSRVGIWYSGNWGKAPKLNQIFSWNRIL